MEVRKGYKRTEVGVIPVDWKVSFLPDVAEVIHGKAHEKHVTDVGAFTIVNSKFISTDGKITKQASENFQPAKVGDVLTVLSDLPNGKALAKCYLVQENDKYAVNQRVCIYRAKNVDSTYLKYILNRNSYFLKFDDGVTQTHLLNHHINKCQIPLPPTKTEQHAIATALSEADAYVAALEALIAKKRQVKQGVMKKVLTPGEGWREVRLGNLLSFQVGFPFESRFFNKRQDGIRLIKNRDLKSDDSITYYDGEYSDDFLVRKGDVLVGMDGDFSPMIWNSNPGLLNQRIGRLNTRSQVDARFVFYLVRRPLKELEEVTAATTVKHLSHKDVESMVLKIPPKPEQTRIANLLTDLDEELTALETQLVKARAVKTGMLGDLLTGRVRVV